MERVLAYERGLGKFRPLDTVVTYDDFDHGFNGWLDLTPNFVYDGFEQHPTKVDLSRWGPIMLSSAPMRYASSHGSMEGTYSLRLATRPVAGRYEEPPVAGSMSCAIKRLSTFTDAHHIQVEAWYTYTPEQDRVGLGETDIRAFGFFFDVQDAEYRWMPGVRYVNSVNGELVKRWQYWQVAKGVTDEDWCFGFADGWQRAGVDNLWYGKRYPDGSADGFQWVDDGGQQLVYNESPDKVNWLYLRLLVDVRNREYVELQSQDATFDLRGIQPTLTEPYAGIHGLVNPIFYVETDTDRRVSMFLDSVVYSVD